MSEEEMKLGERERKAKRVKYGVMLLEVLAYLAVTLAVVNRLFFR